MKVVICNVPVDRAEEMAKTIVEERLAACVNVVPGVVSVYRWKGAVERDEERTLLIKTGDARVAALMDGIRKIHPYEVPEIVVLPVESVNPAYAAWVEAETRI